MQLHVYLFCGKIIQCDAFIRRKNVESGKERGASFAVYHRGEVVIDMWAGYADREAERPWQKETMTLAFSASKGIVGIVLASLVEKYKL